MEWKKLGHSKPALGKEVLLAQYDYVNNKFYCIFARLKHLYSEEYPTNRIHHEDFYQWEISHSDPPIYAHDHNYWCEIPEFPNVEKK